VEVPAPSALLDKLAALPAAAPLLERLSDTRGVYVVGGAIRDLLIGRSPPDLDVVVEGDPAPVAARLGGEIRVYDRFGTATVTLGGHTYDIARARRERYPAPGALPEVEPAPLDEDLKRRDFSVNAIAVELGGAGAGALRALPTALADLEAQQLRVLHDRSFIDDPTRLLRLARYAARLAFEVEPHTSQLARAALAAGALRTVSGPRIGAELRLLAREAEPVGAFGRVHALGLDVALDPRFSGVDADLASRARALLPAEGDQAIVVLALAARAIPAGELAELLDALAFEASERTAIVAAATGSAGRSEALKRAGRPSEIAAALAGAGVEEVAIAGALGPAEPAEEWLARLRHVKLEIDGADLLAAGVEEGPAVGRGLRAALAAKLDGRAQGRAAELSEALRAAR
jgi:tRNA nucleotidyltransferase (CCA-adding enzyme)